MFYLRNVEREIRADKDVAVVENVRLKRELETLQNDLDRNKGSKYRIGGGGGHETFKCRIIIWKCRILRGLKSEDVINQFTIFWQAQSTQTISICLLHNRLIVNFLPFNPVFSVLDDHDAPPSAPPLYDALRDLPNPSFAGVSCSAGSLLLK